METSSRHSLRPTEAKNTDTITLARSLQHVPWCESYEQIISGMSQVNHDPVVMEALLRARKLEYDYNHCPIPDNVPMEVIHKGNQDKLVAILGRVGARARVARPFTCTFGCNVSIGDDSLTMHNLTALDASLITIGNRVTIGPNVTITTQTTNVKAGSRYMFALPVVIEDDCWLGAGCTILPGVTLGKGCDIGAGAVVETSIPPATLAVGVPAKVISKPADEGQQAENIRESTEDDVLGETPLVGEAPLAS